MSPCGSSGPLDWFWSCPGGLPRVTAACSYADGLALCPSLPPLLLTINLLPVCFLLLMKRARSHTHQLIPPLTVTVFEFGSFPATEM